MYKNQQLTGKLSIFSHFQNNYEIFKIFLINFDKSLLSYI